MSAQLPLVRLPVGVVVERRKAASPWIEHVWRPVAVLAGIPEAAPWTEISTAPDAARFFAGSVDIELYRSETAHYRDNLDSGAPALVPWHSWYTRRVVPRPGGRCPENPVPR